MNFAKFILGRPVLAVVISIIIVLFGAIGYTSLGVREYPALDPPVINVRTSYLGASAEIVESQITEPLEKAINGIAGIRSISSASNLGSSNITVEFNLDADMESAANDVRDKVAQAVRQLPLDIDGPPVVTKSDANSDAILTMTVQSETKDELEVSDYATNVILERLQTIPGVSNIQVWGEKKYAMRIWVNPPNLASYGLTLNDVKAALDRENVEMPAGKIEGNTTELTVGVHGRLTSESEFNNLVIHSDGDKTVLLKDIGYAKLGPENEETSLEQSGRPMVGLALVPQPGSNSIAIANEFYKRFEQLLKEVPKDIQLDVVLDNTRFIRQSIEEVGITLAIAFGLVVLVIFVFFRDWVIAFRPLIDIPVSLIGAFFIMYAAGFSINILTLLAIVLATGLVVDDGIVVTENIYKKIEGGMKPLEAAEKGTNEIFFAVISTSLTLAVVFLPVIFLEGFVGRLFREFGIVLVGAVLISAVVSLTLTPVLNVKLSRRKHRRNVLYEKTEPFFEGMVNGYRNILEGFMKTRIWSWVILGISVVLIFLAGGSLKSELAPLEDRSLLRLQVTAPEGSSYEFTSAFMEKLSFLIEDSIPEKKLTLAVTAPGFTGSGAVNTGMMRVRLKDPEDRERTQQQIADYLSKKTSQLTEARAFVIQEQTISVGGPGRITQPIQFVIQAPTFEKLRSALPKFLEAAQKHPTLAMVDANLKFNRPELEVTFDRKKASALGITAAEIANTLRLAYSGGRVAYFTMRGKQNQVIVQVERRFRDEPQDVNSLYVKNKNGQLIQLDNLLDLQSVSSPPQLYHYNRYKSATVSAGLAPGKTIGEGIEAMREIAAKVLDPTFETELTGASRDFTESSSNILFAFLLALALIYLVLSAQFESFIDPLIIMLTVPLALAGALVTLWYFDQTLNIFSEIGMIMLIGLVTKNGILIVEFANQIKHRGVSKREAVIEAAVLRLRPILMTSLATALGALPIALSIGGGAQSRVPMGIAVIGGLIFSLIFTLLVIPAVYTYLSKENKA